MRGKGRAHALLPPTASRISDVPLDTPHFRPHFPQPISSACVPYGSAGVVVTSDQGKERHACRDVIRHLEDAYVARFPAEANPAPGDAPAPVDAF